MSRRDQFETIRTEGALLPAELLQRVRDRDKELGGLRWEDYGLPPNEPLNEAIVRSYNRLVGAWASFQEARAHLPEAEPGTTITRDRWLLVLLQELGYGRVQTAPAVEIDGKSYPVSHAWGQSPIHLVGCRVPIGTRSPGVVGAAKQSPHGTVQELLNRSEERLWGIVSNGLQLRLLRDNSSLTRQAYVEFDLEQMMDGEVYADFVLLWTVCHASRVEGEKPYECWLERWSQEAAKQGTRALEGLRDGVEAAISALGSGFLAHRHNADLKTALRDGELATQDYYRELLRLVYRLLFLFVAEDRALLHDPGAADDARTRYSRWYSTRRLRDLAEKRRGTKHGDLWESLKLVMSGLGSDGGCAALGLPTLGGFLWSDRALPHLGGAELPNRALLEAVRDLATVREGKVLRAVDYKNLGAEELGSVYESLLELHPRLDIDAGTFILETAAGNERKTTGSYYTPTSLIGALLDSALDPVLDQAAAHGEEAILKLKVVDPACGSGHFLVAAAHRIAKSLASARTGDEEPSPEAMRQALRDVVSRCIFGVDVNPMAVELCKVSLWIEAFDPGRPLSFLDAHIKCGNSLLGTTAALMADGIPDDAFAPLEGDDKEIAKALRARNKREREGQLSLQDAGLDLPRALAVEIDTADALTDDDLGGLHEKERRFAQLAQSVAYERARLAADAWCAAFAQEKTKGAPGVTTAVVRRLASHDGDVPIDVQRVVSRLARDYAFFHWELEFPQIFSQDKSGFDCVVGNPPWDQIQLDPREFFASRAPHIAAAPNMAARDRLIRSLAGEDPVLHREYAASTRHVEVVQALVHGMGRFPLTSYGRLNTAPLFAELAGSLSGERGRIGLIVPTGIATDSFNQRYFRHIVTSRLLVSLISFENEAFIFPAVHHAFKFCLLTLTGAGNPCDRADFMFFARRIEDTADEDRHFGLSPDDIALLSPTTSSAPTFRSRRDATLTLGIYSRLPIILGERSATAASPWDFTSQLMFQMNTDSHLFETEPARDMLPLYEGKLIHQFDARWATYEDGDTRLVTEEEKRDGRYDLRPRYWVPANEVGRRVRDHWDKEWLIVWRDICRSVDERTAICSIIPKAACGSTALVAMPRRGPAGCFVANVNSFAFDFVARQKVGGIHLNTNVFRQLPIVAPDAYLTSADWDTSANLGDWLRQRVLELIYTTRALSEFAADEGWVGPPFVWDAERRRLLRAELDAAFFHLYGLEHDETAYVLDTFWVVKDRDLQAAGEYRTKRVILEIYDELVRAAEAGEPYATRLDPPPADPRVAHPREAPETADEAA